MYIALSSLGPTALCFDVFMWVSVANEGRKNFGKNSAQNPAENPASFWQDTRLDMQGKKEKNLVLASGGNPAEAIRPTSGRISGRIDRGISTPLGSSLGLLSGRESGRVSGQILAG